MMKKIKLLLIASRPLLWPAHFIPYLMGMAIVGAKFDILNLLVLAYLTLPFSLYLYGMNDVMDWQGDRINRRKGELWGAVIERNDAKFIENWIIILNVPLIVAIAYLIPNNLARLFFLFVAVVVPYAYSVWPRFRAKPILDSVWNVFYVSPWIWPFLIAGSWKFWNFTTWTPLIYVIATHAIGAAQDYKADKKAGLKSVATFLGIKKTAVAATALYLAAIVMSWNYWPYNLWFGICLLGGMMLTMFPNEETAKKAFWVVLLSYLIYAIFWFKDLGIVRGYF